MNQNMFRICLILCICLSRMLAINADNAERRRNTDAIVVTAESTDLEDTTLLTRQKRQLGNGFTYEYLASPTCFTRSGVVGRCLTFDQCYLYFKMPSPLSQYENLMMSMQDACSYVTPSGNQDVGVCCSDMRYATSNQYPIFPLYRPADTNEPSVYGQGFGNWPPPIPTHPPNHAAPTHPTTSVKWPPPLPTHPPASANPPSPSWTPSTKPPVPKPQWPPTTKPTWPPASKPTWPPASKPTWPPTSKPTWPTSSKPTYPKPEWPPVTKPPFSNPTTAADAEDLPVNLGECGIKNGYQDQERIVGGHNAEPGEWPWMAAILTSGRLFCGGSLIDDTHVLTAAHCVAHMNPWDVARLRVHLGDYNIKSKGDVQHIERRVKKVVRHRGFDPQTLYNDIALLTLDSSVPFSKNVRPICLPQGGKLAYSGRMATVIGWGSLREMGPTPGILQEVNIPIWTNPECRSKYGPAAPGGIVESFLCAGKASKDSCSGDSGGPLMINDGKWQQIGIVSWGIGCGKGQYPGVYTRITSFMSWINKNLNV